MTNTSCNSSNKYLTSINRNIRRQYTLCFQFMIMYSYIFAALIPAVLSSHHHSLPKNFKQCKKNDKNFNLCLRNVIPDAIMKMKTGLPTLGVPPLEPLFINDIKISQGHGPVNLKLHFTDIQMYGIPESTLLSEDMRFNETKLYTEAFTPKLWFESTYRGDGRVLLLPIRGRGKCNITLVDLRTHMELEFQPEEKGNDTYWKMTEFKLNFKPRKLVMYFENLIDSSKEMNDGILRFLNQHWHLVFDELRPSFEDAFGQVFKQITDRIFSRVPIRKIFPEK